MNAKKLISLIYPATIKSGITKQGQVYEINYENGYKVLNSKNANYSFGSLHQIMQKGIFETLKRIQPKKILMLGLGAGSAVEILHKKCSWPIEITALEFDEDLIRFAKEEFNMQRYDNLNIIHADAFEWIKLNSELKFDFIIDDLFMDDQVPEKCLENDFLTAIPALLNDNGIYFRNMMNLSSPVIQLYDNYLNAIYRQVNVYKAKGYENLIYLCS